MMCPKYNKKYNLAFGQGRNPASSAKNAERPSNGLYNEFCFSDECF